MKGIRGVKERAQAGLEYLMTYGWALILIATIVGVLVFVITPPTNRVSFTSSSTKILVKGGTIDAGGGTDSVTLALQNISGMAITITKIDVGAGFATGGNETLNGTSFTDEEAVSIDVPAGGNITIENLDTTYTGSSEKTIEITFQEQATGFTRTATISAMDPVTTVDYY